MALQSSGIIKFSDINVELDNNPTDELSLSDPDLRTLFETPSGTIKISTGYGKSSMFRFIKTISSNTQTYSLSSDLVANGWDEVTPVEAIITVNSGVYV